ncbi:DUF481 domain-containing protein [Halomonas sp. BM-2019]|uniref:DUF481 domain-containing protein n=1 Tax=Halomonas sp. BM-2019 TaxID=2811227 RepID=UPI001B3C3306|nr:MAG: DUF481 domain-containing protein [Halomonas sp. BM-2019]
MPHPVTHTLRSLLCGLLLLAGGAQASPFYAPPPQEEEAHGFSGETELGYTHLSGNTDSKTLIGKVQLTWLRDRWTHLVRSEVRHVSRNGETSAEQYRLVGRERYDLDGPHYLFGFGRGEKDRFSGYDHQLTAIAGYGRDLIEGDRQRLSLEAGPGYRRDRIDDAPNASLAVAYGALDWHFEATDNATLRQELSVEATNDNTTSRSLSSLTARLNARLAMRLSHEAKRNTQPPEGAESRTDHITSVSLLYSW